MARLSSVTVELRATTAKFQASMEKAQSKLKRFRKSTDGARVALASLVGVGSSLAFAGLIKSTIDSGDKLDKLNKRLGASTEFLSQMQHAAKLSGIEFNQFTMGVQRMTRRIAEAGVGTGEAKKALEELGMSGQNLARLSIEEQFYAVADALKSVENPADRVRLAMKFFDSEGVSLIQMMGDGSKGLKEMAAEADRLGITLDQKTAQAMARANDEITRAQASLQGGLTQVSAALAPLIGEIADNFTRSALEANGFADEITKGMQGAASVVGAVADGIRVIQIAFKGAEIAGLGFLGAFEAAPSIIKDIGDGIFQWILTPLKGALEIAAIFSEKAKEALSQLEGASLFPEGWGDTSELDNVIGALDVVKGELNDLLMAELPSQKIKAALDEVIANAEKRTEEMREKIASTPVEVPVVAKHGGETGDEKPTLAEEGKTLTDAMFGEGALQTLFSDFDNIEENFKQLVANMVAEAATAAIMKQLFGGDSGGEGGFDWGGFIAGMFSSGSGGRASGGPVAAGMAYPVGEMGPELFVPNTAGSIVPASKIGDNQTVGGSTQIHFHGVRDADSFRRSETQIAAKLATDVRKGNRNL